MNIKNLLILLTCTIVISFNSACFAFYIVPEKYGTPEVVFPYSGSSESFEKGFELIELNLALLYQDTPEKPSSYSRDWAWKELNLALQSLQQDKIDEDEKAVLTEGVRQRIDAVFAEKEKVMIKEKRDSYKAQYFALRENPEKEKVMIENEKINSYIAKYIAQSLLKVNGVKSLSCDIPSSPGPIKYLAAYLTSPKATLTELTLNALLHKTGISVLLGEALGINQSLKKLTIDSGEDALTIPIDGETRESDSTSTIEGETIRKGIGAGLAINTGLESLSIVHAEFSDEGLAALFDAVSENKALKTLELAEGTKPFGPKSLKSFSNLLKNNRTLTALYFGGEGLTLTQDLLDVLVEAFAVNKTLKHLDLTGISDLDSKKMTTLLKSLEKNDTLESLCLGRLHDEDWPDSQEEIMEVDILLHLLKQNKALKYLELRDLRDGDEEKINRALLRGEIKTRVVQRQLDECTWYLHGYPEYGFARLYDPIELNKALTYLAKEMRKEKIVKILAPLPAADSPFSYLPQDLFQEFATFYTREVVDDGITSKILYSLLKGTIAELGTFLNVKDKKIIKAINTLRGCYNELQAACFRSTKGKLKSPELKTLFVPLPYDGTREEDYISLPEGDFETQKDSFLEMVTQEYIKQLRHGQMWGGDIELGRLANILNLNIEIRDSLHNTTFNINRDHPDANTRNIHLLYDGTHYRLNNHGTTIDVPRDGDCLFHAVLCFLQPDYMMLSAEERAKHVIALRQAIANQLEIEAFGQEWREYQNNPILVRFQRLLNVATEEEYMGVRGLLQGTLVDQAEDLLRRHGRLPQRSPYAGPARSTYFAVAAAALLSATYPLSK